MKSKGGIYLRFFTRCKILYRVFLFFSVCVGLFLGIRLLERGFESLRTPVTYVFLFLVVCLVILKCIILDAEEDLEALLKLKEEPEAQIGRPDAKP